VHKVDSAALACRFISADPGPFPDITPNQWCDFGSEQLDCPHSVAMRQRRNAHLKCQPRYASESLVKRKDLVSNSVRFTHQHGSRGAAESLVVGASHRTPASLLANLRKRPGVAREKLIGRLLVAVCNIAKSVNTHAKSFRGVTGLLSRLAIEINQRPESMRLSADDGYHQGQPQFPGSGEGCAGEIGQPSEREHPRAAEAKAPASPQTGRRSP
jgi:hypothetical protein